MKLKIVFLFLMVISSHSTASITNLEVANQFILFGGTPFYYNRDGEIKTSGFFPETIAFSDLTEDPDGKVNAIIDFTFFGSLLRYQENGLFYNYVADYANDTASFGLTKSGLTSSSLFSSEDVLKHGTELLEQDAISGLFSSSGIYVLNLLEVTCLAVCDDPYSELTALNQTPLPSSALLFLSSLFGFGFFKRFKSHKI